MFRIPFKASNNSLSVRSSLQKTFWSFVTEGKVIDCSNVLWFSLSIWSVLSKRDLKLEKISELMSCFIKSFLSVTHLRIDFSACFFSRLRKYYVDFSFSSYHWHLLLIFTPLTILSYIPSKSALHLWYSAIFLSQERFFKNFNFTF